MTRRTPVNVPASLRQRLLNRARENQQEFQLVLKHYAIERFLYRLGESPHGCKFVLKGAMLFRVWEGPSARQTQDLDLLGVGDAETMGAVMREVSATTVEPDDGLRFQADSVRVEPIRDDAEYHGVRVRLEGTLDSARIPVQIDVGFGDAITPDPREAQYPVLLDLPAPRIRMYPRETVVAEKFQAIVSLSMINTRVKDYYDIWHLARRYEFDGATLGRAIRRTFERRRTNLPSEPPIGLSATYLESRERSHQWTAFAGRIAADAAIPFAEAGTAILTFVLPATRDGFEGSWRPGGPWQGKIGA